MKTNIVLASLMALFLICSVDRLRAEEESSLEARMAAVEDQLTRIEAQLVKLDLIAREVAQATGAPLPAALAAREGPAAAGPASRDEGPLPLPGDDDAAARPEAKDADDLLSLFDELDGPRAEAAAAAVQPPAADPLAQRVARIEQMADRIGSRLKLLDELAQLVDNLGPATAAAGDQPRTAAKPAGPAAEPAGAAAAPAAESSTAAGQGTLVINNWTGVVHWITVNGSRVRVDPGRNRIAADYGPLTTQVGEREREWELSDWRNVGGSYELVLDLKP